MIKFKRGFIPSPIYDDSLLNAWGAIARNVTGLPLTSLCRAYWLANSMDYDIDFTWTGAYSDGTTVAGSVTGTGTVPLNNRPAARRSASDAYPIAAVPPLTPSPNVYSSTITVFSAGGGLPKTQDTYFGFTWFRSLFAYLSGNSQNYLSKDLTQTPPTFLSAAGLLLNVDFTPPGGLPFPFLFPYNPIFSDGTQGVGTPIPIDITPVITVDGVDSDPIAMVARSVGTFDLTAATCTGHAIFDFNSFY